MIAKIKRASQATSGVSGVNAPGIAVEAEIDNGSNIRLYVREGWGSDVMAVNGEIVPVNEDIMDAVELALRSQNITIRLDMDYPTYLNWVPTCKTDYRYGNFDDWKKLNGQTEEEELKKQGR